MCDVYNCDYSSEFYAEAESADSAWSKVETLIDEVNDALAVVARLKIALVDAGVHPNLVEAIANGS